MSNHKVSLDIARAVDRRFYNIEADSEEELFKILDTLKDNPDIKPYRVDEGGGRYPGYIEYAEQEPDKVEEVIEDDTFEEDTETAPSFILALKDGREVHRCDSTLIAFIGDSVSGSITLPFASAPYNAEDR